VSFSDIAQHFTFGGMFLSEARKDRLAFFFAPLYAHLGDRSNPGPFSVDVDADMAVIGAGVSYRVAEWNLDSSGRDHHARRGSNHWRVRDTPISARKPT
jgi:hypothetical protein